MIGMLFRGARLLVLAVAVAVLVVGAVVVAARFLGWQSGPLYYLVALTPYFGLALLIAGVSAVLMRQGWLGLACLVLAGVVGFWWLPVFFPTMTSPNEGLRVMTVNLLYGQADPEAVVAAVRENSVDLLSVQELTESAEAGLQAAGLSRELRFQYVQATGRDEPAAGTGIWSRFPLSDRVAAKKLVFNQLSATVNAPSGPVTFFAIHTVPPSLTNGDKGSRVFAGTRKFMASVEGPAITAGDFNATVDNVPMRNLEADGWVDAATAARGGFVRTWPDSGYPIGPLVAPDHVMTRDVPQGVAVSVVEIPGSDHRAVIATLGAP